MQQQIWKIGIFTVLGGTTDGIGYSNYMASPFSPPYPTEVDPKADETGRGQSAMTLDSIGKLAGVSVATVSRVLNGQRGVARETIEAVERVVKQTGFVLRERRGSAVVAAARASHRDNSVKEIVLVSVGRSADQMPPGFLSLIDGIQRGVLGNDLKFTMISTVDRSRIPDSLLHKAPDGILLTGEQPVGDALSFFKKLPAVWLMANRLRPAFGDQVMPDNTAVGHLAADYLIGRGHKRIAVLHSDDAMWFMRTRIAAFEETAAAAGVVVDRFMHTDADAGPVRPELERATAVVEEMIAADPRPTGLFMMGDRQAAWMQPILLKHGIRPGQDVDVISCNNERPYLAGLDPMPATIDVQVEVIGQAGVQWLLWRMANPDQPGRIISSVEPSLVPSTR